MKLNYRPEIDGLRAIAVTSVIFYHAQFIFNGHKFFTGGFIGVDIFFVISGYLITLILLKELVSKGSISFRNFYERRIRRILPTLLVVILFSLPFAWIYLLPSNFIEYTKSIIYSLGFGSNFYFHFSSQQYGAESGLFVPLLHTWSLSVEEQYYILFPLILLITFKYFKEHLLTIFFISLILSLLIADWGSKNYPSATFYLLHTRIWELLAGSILAYFEVNLGHRSKNRILNLILPTVGIFLILYSIIFFDDKIFHPSFYTIPSIIGICIIIWFSNEKELITKILSSRLFVGVGLISYSLYLWHYPIFAFARTKDNDPSQYDKLEWIFLAVILSIISYIFIEKPARNKKFSFSLLIKIIVIITSLLITFSLNIISNQKKIDKVNKVLEYNKFSPILEKECKFNNQDKIFLIDSSLNERLNKCRDYTLDARLLFETACNLQSKDSDIFNENFYDKRVNSCIDYTKHSPLFERPCKFSTTDTNPLENSKFIKRLKKCLKKFDQFLLIIGDSHSIDLFNSISKISNQDSFVVGLNKDGCRPLEHSGKPCHYSNALKFIKKFNKNIKYIFFTHKGSYLLTNIGEKERVADSNFRKLPLNDKQINNTIDYLKSVKKINKRLIFVGPHLEPNISLGSKEEIRKILINKDAKDNTNYDLLEVDKKLKKLTQKHNITYVSKIDTLKFDFKKDFIVNYNITFSDTDHWNDFGEIYFGEKLVFNSIIKKILFP